ncbi:MAG: hypothetical protein R3D63_05430 [Paracoccaceae bacterium]
MEKFGRSLTWGAVLLGIALVLMPLRAMAGPVVPHAEILPLFPAQEPGGDFGVLLWDAQTCSDCGEGDYGSGEPGKGKPRHRYGTNLNSGTTHDLSAILRTASKTCDRRIEKRYRIDCLRVYYGWVADKLPNTGDYLPIKQAMRTAEKKLSAIVSANVDRSAPVITPREGHKQNAKKTPPLRAVKKSAEKKAIAQAEAVIKETELVILRAGEDPTRRTAHFTEVAQAVDSNLVVLRSA